MQTNLFDPPAIRADAPSAGRFHSRANATEREAARRIVPVSGTLRMDVLRYIVKRGRKGATRQQIADDLKMKLQTVCARVDELRDRDPITKLDTGQGYIYESSKRDSGRAVLMAMSRGVVAAKASR